MELLLILVYAAVCIAVFTVLRIPLNRWTVPAASIGGAVLIFALVQLLNYYHPYSGMSRQYLTSTPTTPDVTGQATGLSKTNEEQNLLAWFHQNAQFRLNDGSAAEVTFDSIPGKVFSGKLRTVLPTPNEDHARAQDNILDPPVAASQPRILVLINITDPRYARYSSQIPDGSQAQTAVYGEQFHHLALVRKTLLRMSSWMNYLSLSS
jgi:energy-coupling factor transporter transmembrane protein EcfT